MKRAKRAQEQKRNAYRLAERYAREWNPGMMRMYILSAREVDGVGLTPKQVARLEALLVAARMSDHGTSI